MAYVTSETFPGIQAAGGLKALLGAIGGYGRQQSYLDDVRPPLKRFGQGVRADAPVPLESSPAALAFDKRMLDAGPIHRLDVWNGPQQSTYGFREGASPGDYRMVPPMPAQGFGQAPVPMPQATSGFGMTEFAKSLRLQPMPTRDQVAYDFVAPVPWTLQYDNPAEYARLIQQGRNMGATAHNALLEQMRQGVSGAEQNAIAAGHLGVAGQAEGRLAAETRGKLSQAGRRAAMENDIFKSRLAVHGNAEQAARETAAAMAEATGSGLFSGDLGEWPGGGNFPITPGALGGGQRPQEGPGQILLQPPQQRGKINVQPGEAPTKYKSEKKLEDVFTDKFFMGPAGQGGERKRRELPDFLEAVHSADQSVFLDPGKYNKLVDFINSNYGASAANQWLQSTMFRWSDPRSIDNLARRRVLEAQERFTGLPALYTNPVGSPMNPEWSALETGVAQLGNIGRWVGRNLGGEAIGRGLGNILGR